MQTRSENFQQRVSIERRVLQLINTHRYSKIKLPGLSMAAINCWEKQNDELLQREKVVSLLREFSARLNVEADKSKQVFDSIPVPNSLAMLAGELEELLQRPATG